MFESLEKAQARYANVDQRAAEPPVIRTVQDIQNVLKILDPKNKLNDTLPELSLNTDLVGSTDDRDHLNFSVRAKLGSHTYRAMLLDGIMSVKNKINAAEKVKSDSDDALIVNDRVMAPPSVLAPSDLGLAIDPLIRRLLGAYRNGEYICWDLQDGFTYQYEIAEHRLTRYAKHAKDDAAATGVS